MHPIRDAIVPAPPGQATRTLDMLIAGAGEWNDPVNRALAAVARAARDAGMSDYATYRLILAGTTA